MDPALAARLARMKKQQEEAEEEEWRPTPKKEAPREEPPPRGRSGGGSSSSNTVPFSPAKPSVALESTELRMDESDPVADVIADALALQLQDEDDRVPETVVACAPPHATAPAPVPAVYKDPFEEFHQSTASSAGSVPLLYEDPVPQSSSHAPAVPTPESFAALQQGESARQDPSASQAAEGKKKKKARASDPLATGDETFTKISGANGTSVPVLVIPTPGAGAGNWRQGAQDASSAYNGLIKKPAATGANGSSRPVRPEQNDALLKTMAKKNSKIISALSPRNLGAGSIWGDEISATGDETPAPGELELHRGRANETRDRSMRSSSPKSKKKHGNRSTSVPAQSRASLLDNNILALSTGSIDERSQAARRICGRATTIEELRKLVQAGVVRSVASLLAEPKGMHAAVDALLPLCAHVGPSGEPSTQELLKEFCFELEAHGISEKLSALLCWSSTPDSVKGKIATVMFYLAKEDNLANRIVKQDGALRSLVQLLDSENEAINSSAAAALANITYWSSEPVPRYSHLRVLAAV